MLPDSVPTAWGLYKLYPPDGHVVVAIAAGTTIEAAMTRKMKRRIFELLPRTLTELNKTPDCEEHPCAAFLTARQIPKFPKKITPIATTTYKMDF
jgi:hypothetical protein